MTKKIVAFVVCLALCITGVTYAAFKAVGGLDTGFDSVANGFGNGSIDNVNTNSELLTKATVDGATVWTLNRDVTINSTSDADYQAVSAALELVASDGRYSAPSTHVVFDGNNNTITTSVPLFKRIGNCTVKNLNVVGDGIVFTDSDFVTDVNTTDYSNNIAVIAAMTYGTVNFENVTVDVDMTYEGTGTTGRSAVVAGVFVGRAVNKTTLNFKNCINNSDVTVTPTKYSGIVPASGKKQNAVAGIVGSAGGTTMGAGCTLNFDGCVNNGNVTFTYEGSNSYVGDTFVGGIGGFVYYSVITARNCVNAGDVTSVSTCLSRIAGFFGHSGGGITKCYDCVNLGNVSNTVTGNKSSRTAGFANVGSSGHIYERCINAGDITMTPYSTKPKQPIAGIVAYTYEQMTSFVDCINVGKITANSDNTQYIGALIGRNTAYYTTFSRCCSYQAEGSAAKLNGEIIELTDKFTAASTGTANGNDLVFTANLDGIFYECVNNIANGDGENTKELEFGAIVMTKEYADKIGNLTHESVDAYYDEHKSELEAQGISSLYVDGDKLTVTGKGIVNGMYSMDICLSDAASGVNYVARPFVRIGDIYIYGTVK